MSARTLPKIHICGPEAAARLSAIQSRCFETVWEPEEFRRLLSHPDALGLIAQLRARDGGFALFQRAGDEADLVTLGVAPHARDSGVGSALLSHGAALLAMAGARRLFLEVAADNGAARALYARAGFVEAGRRRGYYRRGGAAPAVDALILRRDLGAG